MKTVIKAVLTLVVFYCIGSAVGILVGLILLSVGCL